MSPLSAFSTAWWKTGPSLIVLTLWPVSSGGPLEVKTNQTVRMAEHSLGAVFWTWQDFVGQRKIAVDDLLELALDPADGHVLHF